MSDGSVRQFRSAVAQNAAAFGFKNQQATELRCCHGRGSHAVSNFGGKPGGRRQLKEYLSLAGRVVDEPRHNADSGDAAASIVKSENVLVAFIQSGIEGLD